MDIDAAHKALRVVMPMLSTYQDWIVLGMLVLPLIVIAWALTWRVLIEAERNRHERYRRFYSVMEQLSRSDAETAAKMAAAYELRNYREYADIVAKVFVDGRMRHDTTAALKQELAETLKHIERAKTH